MFSMISVGNKQIRKTPSEGVADGAALGTVLVMFSMVFVDVEEDFEVSVTMSIFGPVSVALLSIPSTVPGMLDWKVLIESF